MYSKGACPPAAEAYSSSGDMFPATGSLSEGSGKAEPGSACCSHETEMCARGSCKGGGWRCFFKRDPDDVNDAHACGECTPALGPSWSGSQPRLVGCCSKCFGRRSVTFTAAAAAGLRRRPEKLGNGFCLSMIDDGRRCQPGGNQRDNNKKPQQQRCAPSSFHS